MSVVLLLQKSNKIEYLYIFWSEDRDWFCFQSFLRFLMFDDNDDDWGKRKLVGGMNAKFKGFRFLS